MITVYDNTMPDRNRGLFEFLLEAGAKVEAKLTTVATAVLYFHRFLKVAPPALVGDDHHTIAAVCLYVAGKVEEDFIRIRDIINVAHRILHPNEAPLDIDEQYWTIREGLGRLEMIVLRFLGFQLQHEHPHKYLLHYLKTVEGWVDRETWSRCPCARTALSILTDCYIQPEFLLENTPQSIAASVIYVALKIHGIQVPYADSNDEKPWWNVVCGMRTQNLLKMADRILNLVHCKE